MRQTLAGPAHRHTDIWSQGAALPPGPGTRTHRGALPHAHPRASHQTSEPMCANLGKKLITHGLSKQQTRAADVTDIHLARAQAHHTGTWAATLEEVAQNHGA